MQREESTTDFLTLNNNSRFDQVNNAFLLFQNEKVLKTFNLTTNMSSIFESKYT